MHRSGFIRRCLLLCALLSVQQSGLAAGLTVIYPQVKAPYDEIFRQIISGVQQQYPGQLELVALDNQAAAQQVADRLKRQPDQLVIALGKSGYQVAQQIYHSNSVVVGALPIAPNGVSGVSLLAEPKVLFNSLRRLAPAVTKVAVLYTRHNRWLIGLAKQQALAQGLTLDAREVADLKEAMAQYQQLIDALHPATDALWLPLDPVTANEQVVLPRLLELAWERNLVLFSSKPEHARRGALFSLFPNHQELGRELVQMVQQLHHKEIPAGVVPLQQVQLAVNLRTAAHLGMDYSTETRRSFAITFQK